MWNLACGVREPLLSAFRHPVLVDLDPGHLQVSALTWDLDIASHRAFLTVGTKMHDADCGVPTLGVSWTPFLPFVYLPWWPMAPDPGPQAPVTSVTQWTWEQLWWGDRVLSVSERDAYLHYITLPHRVALPFELAVNLHPADQTGDRTPARSRAAPSRPVGGGRVARRVPSRHPALARGVVLPADRSPRPEDRLVQ